MKAEFMVDLLRRVRHDFANHLQVISGYLQLDQPEQVQDYLHKILDDMAAERIIFQSLPGAASLYLYDQLLAAYDQGITLRFEDIELESWELLKANGEPAAGLAVLKQDLNAADDDQIVYLSIYEEEKGIDLLFCSGDDGTVTRMFRINKE